MEIKNILQKINQTPQEPQNFFAVEIGHEVIKTAVWQVKDKITQIVSVGSIEEWNSTQDDSIVHAIDRSFEVTLKSVENEPNEVIFGLPETWVAPDGIVDSKKPILKSITQRLELKPVGFVVTTEAIVHHLRIKEGGPPSTVLISLTESEAIVSLVKLGEIIGTQAVGRSDDLCKDVEEGLARFGTEEEIPSRMVIYDGNIDLEAAKQVLISYDWKGAISFLHFPKIESLSPQSSIKAVAIAGGTEVARSLGISVKTSPEEEDLELKESGVIAQDLGDQASSFGFEDVDELEDQMPMIGDNFKKVDHLPMNDQPEVATTQNLHGQSETVGQESLDSSHQSSIVKKKRFNFKFKLPKFKFKENSKVKFRKTPLMIGIGITVLMIIFGGGLALYWHLPKATITIYVHPKKVEKQISFTLSSSADQSDNQVDIIPATEESIELEGEREVDTKGVKIVGERASGTVNIFNLTSSQKTFPAGTEINIDQYRFTTNETISIASATAELGSDYKKTVTPTQESVKVTAIDIGDQYNFSTGSELSVENFSKSSFVAKATSDFTGGFAREIQAVSKEDQDGLKAALLEELKQQGVKNLSVIASQKKGVVELEEETIVSETFSSDVGDEKDLLRLALKFKLPIYTYQISDISKLMEEKYQADFPANFSFDRDNIEVEIIESSIDDNDDVNVAAKVSINLSPEINPEEIARNIRGKYPDVTKDYFTSLPSFSKVETQFSMSLPVKLQTFPRKAENISIDIKLEKN